MNLSIVMRLLNGCFMSYHFCLISLWRHSYWVGMFVIGLPLLKKVVDIFRRLL